jgi:digeranylgeranylglycerophospholipid reductase
MKVASLEKYDIVIIGGGVAGLSTALPISGKSDVALLLIEKSVVGNPTKTSPFTFPDVVERFHLSNAVLQRYTRFTYRSPTGVTASFKYERPAFVTLDYEKTCNIMLNYIIKEGNTRILEKTEAIDLEVNKTDMKLALSNSTAVSCKVLVDASGSCFFASRKLGIELSPLYSHPYGEFLEGCKIEDPEEMCIFSGNKYGNGGGWMYPIDKKTARFGFATVTRTNAYPKEVVEGNFREATRDFYPYNEMLAGAKRKRAEFGTIPFGPLEKLVHGQILIVGDAAGQATPWYGEGVRPALESGEMCGKIIAEAYQNGKLHRSMLKKYQRLWDARNRKVYSARTRYGYRSYFRTQHQWDDSVRNQASLTAREMIDVIRYSKWPTSPSKLLSQGWHRVRSFISRSK